MLKAIGGVAVGLTPAILARDPLLAVTALESIGRLIAGVSEFVEAP